MEMEVDSDEDTEVQLHELNQLTAVLTADEPSMSESGSQYTNSTSTVPTYNSKPGHDLTKIDTALALNKVMDQKLQRLEKILENRLRQCTLKLEQVVNKDPDCTKQESFRYFLCGKPYFKDGSGFPAPDNEDTIIMTKSQMFDFSQVLSVPGWTVKDKSQFITEIHKMSQDIRRDELHSKVAQIRRDGKIKECKVTEKKIAAVQEEIDDIQNKSLNELALPLNKEYDWDTLANRLNRRHTAQEYQSLWKLFFHPCINKNSWTKAEHTALQKLASENNLEDWDEIAMKLDTGRTGYQCFVYFRTNMTNVCNGRKWSKEEVEYLRRLIDYYREDKYIPWGKIAAAMENRTKIQIYNKYMRLYENRKGRFVPEEDAVILNCASKFGTNFKKMMNYLPGRSMVQIRLRYNVLTKVSISAVWTVKEDRKLLQLMANQDSNLNFSSISKYFPGKDRVHIRTRYIILAKWMKKFPDRDISHAPRRAARRLIHGKPTENLNIAIENLKNRMQSEFNSKKSKKITSQSQEHHIDDAIVTTLYNELIQEEEIRDSEEEWHKQFLGLGQSSIVSREYPNIANLRRMLIILNAKLDKRLFDKSEYTEVYPGLADTQEMCLVKVKSYSRKDKIKTIEVNKTPDIWGNNNLGQLKNVLPPNYATITGCRALMAYMNMQKQLNENEININVLIKRNQHVKDQVYLLMERFNVLFLWPMLLSNEGPNLTQVHTQIDPQPGASHIKSKQKSSLTKLVAQSRPEITIPSVPEHTPMKNNKKKNKELPVEIIDPSKIDLVESTERDEVTLKEDLSELRLLV